MATSIPKTNKAWTVEGKNGFDSLKLNTDAPVPEPSDYEVLVKFHAASLNYRDLIIPQGTFLSCHKYFSSSINNNIPFHILLWKHHKQRVSLRHTRTPH